MPDDNEPIDFEHRFERAEQAAVEDAKEINALKAEIAGLRDNTRDVLRIVGVSYGIPFVQPGMRLLPEQAMGYDASLERLRRKYFEFLRNRKNKILVESFW
jgi:hypothetical protein